MPDEPTLARLLDLLEDRLDPADADALRARLATDEALRADLAGWRELLGDLRAIADRAPATVRAAAAALAEHLPAPSRHDPFATLERLVARLVRREDDGYALRGAGAMMLAFAADGVAIDVELTADEEDPTRDRVLGQVDPEDRASAALEVAILDRDDSVIAETTTDERGRFRCDAPSGRAAVVVVRHGGRAVRCVLDDSA